MKRHRTLTLLVRLGVSAGIIGYLFRSTGLADTVQTVLQAGRTVWLSGIILYVLGQVVSAYKWKLLSGAAGFRTGLRDHVSYYFIGMFFNLFLPTSIGGDAVKCYYLSRNDPGGRTAPAVYTVLAERLTGFIVMLWIGSAALFLAPGDVVGTPVPVLAAACSVLSTLFILFFPFLIRLFKRRAWAQAMLRDVTVYWHSPGVILRVFFWSFVFHLMIVAIHVVVGKSMGLTVPPAYYAVVYPAASLAGFIPVSFNGIGPREGAYVYLFSLIGTSRPDALAFAIFWLGIMICASLPGGVLYVLRGEEQRAWGKR